MPLAALEPSELGTVWLAPRNNVYMPLTFTVWRLTISGFGESATAFHAVNLALHLVNVLLVFLALQILVPGRRGLAALVGAAVMAVHPMVVEPVAWITSLKDLLSTAFALGAINVWLRAGDREGRYVLAAILVGLATLAKPTAIMVVLVLGILDWHLGRFGADRTGGSFLRVGRRLAVAALLGAPAVWLTASAQSTLMVPEVPWTQRPALIVHTLGWYVRNLIWPWPRLAVAGMPPARVLAQPIWGDLTALLLAAGLAIATWRRAPSVARGLLVLLMVLLPVCGLLTFGAQLNTHVADRYVYLGLFGVAWTVAAGWVRLPDAAALPAVVVMLTACVALTHLRLPAWADDEALWQADLAQRPDSVSALGALATAQSREGDLLAAVALYRRALAVDPNDYASRLNLGALLGQLGDYAGAIEHSEAALSLQPRSRGARDNLDRARRLLNESLLTEPLLTEPLLTEPLLREH